jgi:hypothetical protein
MLFGGRLGWVVFINGVRIADAEYLEHRYAAARALIEQEGRLGVAITVREELLSERSASAKDEMTK